MTNERKKYLAEIILPNMTLNEIKPGKVALSGSNETNIEIEAPEVFDPNSGNVRVRLNNLESKASWEVTKRKGYKYSIFGQRIDDLNTPHSFRKNRESQFPCTIENLTKFIKDEMTKKEFDSIFLESSEKMQAALIFAVQEMQDLQAL